MIDTYEVIIRLASAAFCGALIGLERERKEWAAGMRTHMMVAVGSCLYMIVSAYGFDELLNYENISVDPSRIASQVVSGIGFLGAGTIIFLRQGIVRGLTTASGLWTVAAIGLAIGTGMFWAGLATTAIAIIILWLLQPIEKLIFAKKLNRKLIIEIDLNSHASLVLSDILDNANFKIRQFSLDHHDDSPSIINITATDPQSLKEVAAFLGKDNRIRSVRFE